MLTVTVSATRFVSPRIVLHSCGRKLQLLLLQMLKLFLFYLSSELKYPRWIAISFFYITCPISLFKKKRNLTLGFLAVVIAQESFNWRFSLRYSLIPVEKSDLIKYLDVNTVVCMQLLPFLLGHCSPHFAVSRDSMKQ